MDSQILLASPPKKSVRLAALDAYRGLVIFGMILVDNQTSKPLPPLDESEWDGLSPADLIFPAFIFMMGMAVPLSIRDIKIGMRPLLRTAGLFLIGFFLHLQAKNFNFQIVRIMGVLQRIALCYLSLVLIHISTELGKKQMRIIGVVLVTSAIYIGLMIGQSYSMGCSQLSPTCNFGREIDIKILGYQHMMKPSDPEGLLSTFSSLLTGLGGYWVSLLMKNFKEQKQTLVRKLSQFSLFQFVLTLLLIFVQPINKKLWSISFSTVTIGISTLSFLLVYLLLDFRPQWYITNICNRLVQPFVWYGMNSLLTFVGMLQLDILLIDNIRFNNTSLWSWLYHNLFVSWLGNNSWSSLLFSFCHALLWLGICFACFRKKVFLRL